MSRQFLIRSSIGWLALCVAAVGCRPQQPYYFFEHKDMSHYLDVATTIDYPDVKNPTLDDVQKSLPPLTLDNPDPSKIWELSLEDAMKIALENSKVIRSLGGAAVGQNSVNLPGGGGAVAGQDLLLSQPGSASTTYEPALAESDARFGVEAALAAYDAQFTASMDWERHDTPLNVNTGNPSVAPYFTDLRLEDVGNWQAQIQKTYMTGGTWSLANNIDYLKSNSPIQLFPSAYTVNFEASVRQPLLQGAGVQFNEIAGTQSIPGFYNGVRIARLRTDIALADFEAAVRNQVSDMERVYWQLYLAYRRLATAVEGRDRALDTWRKVNSRFRTGGDKDVGAQAEARAREQYFQFRGGTEDALSTLYQTENQLRNLMGLAPADGRLIRPSDEPTTAKISFDWYESLTEGLCRSVELRQQKWRIKQRELELIASKNFLLPRLDGTALYRWVGLGNSLDDPTNTSSNAFGNLIDGAHQEWQLELQLQVPIGFRKEMAGVRNAQLSLARERTILQEQELDLSHRLAQAIRYLADNYKVSQTNFNRLGAAEAEVKSLMSAFDHGEPVLNVLLDAELRLTEAESDYYNSIVNYNTAIAGVHFRKGSLLEYNGVYLAEGPWPHKAYFDAQRRARSRDAALYFNYGFTMPRVLSRGPIQQNVGSPGTSGAPTPLPAAPSDKEVIPPGTPVEKSPEEKPSKSILPDGATGVGLGPQGAGPVDSPLDPRWGSTEAPIGKGCDLGSLNLIALAASPDRPSAAAQPADASPPAAVQQAAYQDTEGAGGVVHPEAVGGQWKSSQAGGNGNEPVTHLPPAETDRSTPGWKGL
jgi:outer membrane protein TolC